MSKTMLGLSESQRAWAQANKFAKREYLAGCVCHSWFHLIVGAARLHGDF
jgi:hypothetical protein